MHSWKLAANGIWEEALEFDASQKIDSAIARNWVLKNPQNIAVEAIFAQDGTPATMFGIRITSLSKTEQAARIENLLFRTGNIKIEADFKKVAAEVFPEFPLFSGPPEALNIGIVGQWYSFGEKMIWNGQDGHPLTVEELKEEASKFFEPTFNPAAIEFWYTQPTDHWYKIYVSNEIGGKYLISPDKYNAAIERLADFITA